jgi:sigma-B regulation protein RsbU (phosphoserine phosphatase)
MISLGELRLPAVRENLRTISYFLHGIARRLDLTEDALFEIEVAVEEAAVNIISHAYPPGKAGDILVQVEASDDVVHITLADWGIALNPAQVKPFNFDAPVETRIEGGMGLHLIQSLMNDVVRKASSAPGEPNRLTLTKKIKQLEPGVLRPSSSRELRAIRTVSEFMVSGIALDELLALIINELVGTIGAARGALYLVDEQNDEVFSHVLIEETGVLREIRLKMGEGIAGYVAATGEVLNIENAYDDPRFMQAFDQMTGYRTHTVLTAPVRNPQGRIIGVVQLLNKFGGPFTSRDERLLTAMAAQAAISIENARLYEQEIQQRLINQELGTARMIQESFLPQAVPQHPGWEIGAFWWPMREVAGDFYDFYALPDGRLALLIADVSGKGVPAALFMALSVTVLRFAMSLSFPPKEVLSRANTAIISDQQSRMFATVFLGYLDLDFGILEYSSAGHNPPLLYRAATGSCERLAASGVAIGLFEEAEYIGKKVALLEGDVLVLYTDGITELIDADEEEFGEERLEALVLQNISLPPQDLTELIVDTACDFAGEAGAVDDETIVVIRCLGAGA